MYENLQQRARTGAENLHKPLLKGTAWGLAGGFAATLLMDLALMGALAALGQPPLGCYSLVGDTIARLFTPPGALAEGGVLLGIATHYTVGPLLGALFGAAVMKSARLRIRTLKKAMILAILYAEIFSQPLLALTPILLPMTPSEILQWYGGSLVMHFIWGCVLGWVAGLGLRNRAPRG